MHLSGADQIVQRLHRLFDRRVMVPAMDLIQIDVVGAESLQTLIDLMHDRLAGETLAKATFAHPPAHLRSDNDVLAIRHIGKGSADDLFAGSQ